MQDAVGSGTVQKPDYVITLVHGTILFSQSLIRRRGAPAQSRLMDLVALLLGAVYYAVDRVCARLRRIDPPPDALNWTRPHSPFRDTLERDLGRPVVFREFRWSGHNSHLDRLVAAEHLREHLRTVSADYPAARQVVIGHSHGGNVVLYALRDPDIRQRVAAVVTLATPFLKVRAQPTMVPWLVLGVSVILLLAVAPGLAALAAAGAGWLAADWIEPLVGRPVAFGPMFLGAWSIGTFLFCILHFRELLVLALALTGDGAFRRRWGNVMRVASSLARRSSRLLDYQTRRVRRLTLPACTDMPILCLRAPNDEIGRFLKRVERWSRSPIALWQRFFGTLYVGFTLVLAGLFFTAYFSQPRLWADGMLRLVDVLAMIAILMGIMTFAAVLLALVGIGLVLATIFLSRFFRSHRFGFGGEKILDHVLLDISVADEPPGWAHCTPREVRIETPKRCIRDMVHNEICNDERVAADVAAWLGQNYAYLG